MTNEEMQDVLEELMTHYESLSEGSKTEKGHFYFVGTVDGLNKAWKLLNGEDIEDLKG